MTFSDREVISDSFALSPVQQGMLFHHLSTLNSGVDIEQIVVEYPEAVDEAAIRAAWEAEIANQPVLRTAFRWRDLPEPVQEIHRSAELEFSSHSSCGDPEFEAYLLEDRRRGFDLLRPPLLRLAYFSAGPAPCRIVWTFHHILIDGRSFASILEDVDQRYERIRRGEPVPPEPAALDEYKSFIAGFGNRDRVAAGDFWRTRLNGLAAPTPLPLDLEAPGEDTADRYGEQERRLTESLSAQLRLLAENTGVTLNTVTMAAWAVLLGRYCGESDVVFGATKTARRGTAAVGLYLNTIPVRVDVSRNLAVTTMLQELRRRWIDLRQHEDTPLVEIKEASQLGAAAGLFDSLVVFENQRFDRALAERAGGWASRRCRLLEQTNYGLSLLVYGDPEILVKLEYDARRYSRPMIGRFLGHLKRILEEMAARPQALLGELQMLSDAERRQMVEEWNRTEAEYPRDVLTPEAIARGCAATPEGLLVSDGVRMSYGELNGRANQLARHLGRTGIGPGALVGVHIERSPEMLIALLAVMKSGAAYVPLDPGFPAGRLAFMAEDAALRAVITGRQDSSILPADIPRILIDADWPEISRCAADDFAFPTKAEDIAYVLYTSGSTGKPKGVEISHRALANFLYAMERQPGLTGRDVLLAVTTISFDIAGLELYLPLMTGAGLVLASRAQAADPGALARLMEEHQVTAMQATPATWQMMLDTGWTGRRGLKILCGGEALSRNLAARLLDTGGELWNMYGPTETTIWSLVRRILPSDRTIRIGRPIANTTTYVLDEDRRPLPAGVTGELYIGGEGVARGYRNRPDLTRERFLADPFRPGQTIYRTGDLARFWPDGEIECLGRNDFQVKIRGFRIELGEIEAALAEHPAIRQPLLAVRDDEHGKRLVAYLIAREGALPAASELKAFLGGRIPDYMVPGQFIFLASFPLTPNGKVNRLALPAPDPKPVEDGPYLAPRDEFEQMVSEVFAEVLGLARVGLQENFFDLGGHSLLAVRLMVRLQQIIPGEPLPLAALLESPTVEQLAGRLRNRAAGEFGYLVRMRAGSSARPPFFCVHGAGGNVLSMRSLAMALPDDLPFYCLQARGLDGAEPFQSVEDAAAGYVEEIRSIQPDGPYYVGGGCFGGVVAFEMARRLEAQGETVACLLMMDSYNVNFGKFLPAPRLVYVYLRFLGKRLLANARRLASTPPHRWELGSRLRALNKVGRELFRVAVGRKSREITIDPNVVEIAGAEGTQLGVVLARVRRAGLIAAGSFVPKPYSGKAILMVARERRREPFEDPQLGWGPVVKGGIEVFTVEGDHESIFAEDVGPLAELVNAKLLDAQAKSAVVRGPTEVSGMKGTSKIR